MAESTDQYVHSYLNDPNSDLFDSVTVDRFLQTGEQDFASEIPCIHTRLALDIVSGTATYQLPDNVISIRRIAWKGYKLDPLPYRQEREIFQRANQSGRPFWYIFNNIGLNKIKFFPIPNETIASATGEGLWGSDIVNRVIIDYFRAPDFSTNMIPAYFRRRLLKAYGLYGCFQIEGQGQNIKAVQYWKQRWLFLKDKYRVLIAELHNKPRKLVLNSITASYYFPGAPVLPVDKFGSSVDIGE